MFSLDIAYFAVDTDDEGFPTIADNHEDAVSAYLMFRYKARDYYNGKLARNIYVDFFTEQSISPVQQNKTH